MHAAQRERYSRQILFAPIGETGQRKICAASVAILGCGALGSFQAEALARAGVGRLVLIDRDYVEYSNLQRQWLYEEADAEQGLPKAVAAGRRIARINQSTTVETHVTDLRASNAEDLVEGCDLVLDGTDNFESRYLLNDVCVKHGIPWIYGAALGSYGIMMPILPGVGPCFSCVYPAPPEGVQPNCDVSGILSSTTAAIGAMQVAAGLRMLVGWPEFSCKIHTLNIWEGTSRAVAAGDPDEQCETCGKRVFSYLDLRHRSPVSLCGRNAVQLHAANGPVDLEAVAARLRDVGNVRLNDFALRLTVPDYDVTLFQDGRAIVKGTTEVEVARSVYSRLLGLEIAAMGMRE